MLVLSRKPGESIRIGENIEITVAQVSGSRVRIAIAAPREVAIRRSELEVMPGKPTAHLTAAPGLILEAIA